ncbi:MAG: hypothetical protein ACYTGZ_03915 [Planctomycetota bacterium]|jgi:hypothetical protein
MLRVTLPLVLLALPAAADTLYLKTNGKPVAKDILVVEETDDKYVYLDKSLKRRSYSKSMIGSMTRERTDIHEYKERFEALKGGSEAVELALWAKKKKFGKNVIADTYEKAVELDPANTAAHEALGHVQYKGEWMTPAEREKRIEADEAEAMRAKGLVLHEGEWVTPEDKANLEKGLRKFEGKWLTPDQIKEAQGFVKFGGKWVKKDQLELQKLLGPARRATGLGDRLQLRQTDHYAILGDLPPAQLEILGKQMEKLHAEWLRMFPTARTNRDLLPGKQRVYVFKKARPYQKLCKWVYDQYEKSGSYSKLRMKQEKVRMKMRQRETSFWEIQFQRVNEAGKEYGGAQPDEVMSAHVQMPDPFEAMKAHCIHFGANILATRHDGVRFPTWWLNESLAYYFEIKLTGSAQTFSLSVGGGGGDYAKNVPVLEGQKNPWLDSANWQAKLLTMAREGRDPKLERFKGKGLFDSKNRLTAKDLAKGWSVVTYLSLDNAKKFAAFVHDAKTGPGSDAVEREVSAVIKHYGSYRKIEEGWRKYALNNYRIPR